MQIEVNMSENLKKYLSDVFRNDVKSNADSTSQEKSQHNLTHLADRNMQKFVLDRRYTLRLDEII